MTQRKFVFMKFEDSLFLHFSEFFGEGAPVEVQVVGEALAVEGDRKGVGAGFGRLRGEVDQHALADRLWCSAENAVGEGKIFLHGDAEHVTAKLGQPCIITIGGSEALDIAMLALLDPGDEVLYSKIKFPMALRQEH